MAHSRAELDYQAEVAWPHTVEVEAKAKEQAVIQLRADLEREVGPDAH